MSSEVSTVGLGGGGDAACRVPVALGARSYEVLIGPGLVERAGALIKAAVPGARCGIVTDTNVARHHLAGLEAGLGAAGLLKGSVTVPAGEQSKSFPVLADLCERLLEMKLERGDAVVALGGGVVGDLAGFAASILRRGIRFVQMPTSLLAQVDSSVGGKTGINTPQGKNLIGAFHQPSLVLADIDTLKTLPDREFRAGYAEMAKFGLLGDAAFFDWLEASRQGIFGLEPQALTRALEVSVSGKGGVVARDETETGERALLNLGHTFGHALEAFTGYSDRLLHGEGVAIGICLALRFSEHERLCPAGTAARAEAHFKAVGLPTRIQAIDGDRPGADDMLRLMAQDKKVREGKLTFILARRIGEAFIASDVSPEAIRAFLDAELGKG